MPGVYVLNDPDTPVFRPLTRLRSRFALRDGIYTTLERLRRSDPDCTLIFRHPDETYERLIAKNEGLQSYSSVSAALRKDAQVITAEDQTPADLLSNLAERFGADLELLLMLRGTEFGNAGSPRHSDRFHDLSVHVVGPPDQVLLHEQARVLPGCVFDVREGPVVLDRDVEVSPFSFLQGPLYVGAGARLDNLRITGGCIVGTQARLGGEIENSIINDFANKHHEGFLGHSIVAPWVNIGALATTSDLKNNYGPVRLQVPNAPLPHNEASLLTVDTGTIKFGALLGECVKIAIGTMLSTGSVVDAGANLFGARPESYTPPFRWGTQGIYEAERFIADSARIFARRQQTPGARFADLVRRLHPESKG